MKSKLKINKLNRVLMILIAMMMILVSTPNMIIAGNDQIPIATESGESHYNTEESPIHNEESTNDLEFEDYETHEPLIHPEITENVEGLSAPRIALVSRDSEHWRGGIEFILLRMGLSFDTVIAADLSNISIARQYSMIILDSGDDRMAAPVLRQFVAEGGVVIAVGFAGHDLAKAFPSRISFREIQGLPTWYGGHMPIRGLPILTHSGLAAFLNRPVNFVFWLHYFYDRDLNIDKALFIDQITDDADIYLDIANLINHENWNWDWWHVIRYKSPLIASFNYGLGRAVFMPQIFTVEPSIAELSDTEDLISGFSPNYIISTEPLEWDEVFQYIISLHASSISAAPDRPDFGEHVVGYNQRPLQTITITNTGTQNVTLYPLPDVPNYLLTANAGWGTAMPPGATRSFTIRPHNVLPVGVYNPTIVITGTNNTRAEVRPTFEVAPATNLIESLMVRNMVPIRDDRDNDRQLNASTNLLINQNSARLTAVYRTNAASPGNMLFEYSVHSSVQSVAVSYRFNGGSASFIQAVVNQTNRTFTLPIPVVGAYDLEIRFELFGETNFRNPIGERIVNQRVYSLLGRPRAAVVRSRDIEGFSNHPDRAAATGVPRIAWLEMAMNLLKQETHTIVVNDSEFTMNLLMNGVYNYAMRNRWNYNTFEPSSYAVGLIEGRNLGNRQTSTDCSLIGDVLMILAKSIGIDGVERQAFSSHGFEDAHRPWIRVPTHFIVSAIAFDNNRAANAFQVGNIHNPPGDHPFGWYFWRHYFPVRNGTYFDPTFRIVGRDFRRERVYAERNVSQSHPNLPLNTLTRLSDGATHDLRDNVSINAYGWGTVVFSVRGHSNTITSNFLQSTQNIDTINVSYNLIDEDNNGLAEWLAVDIRLNTDTAFKGNLITELYSINGDFIATSNLIPILTSQRTTWVELSEGENIVTVYFNGRHIRNAGFDGYYEINIRMKSSYTSVDEWLSIGNLSSQSFQGNLLEIVSVSDNLINDGDILRFTAEIYAELAGNYDFTASLYKPMPGHTIDLGVVYFERHLNVGSNILTFDFDAKYIRAVAGGGQYTLSLFAKDLFYTDYRRVLSAVYEINQLAVPPISFNGDFTSGDVAAQNFDVTIPIAVGLSGKYSVRATLWGNQSNFLDGQEVLQAMEVGAHNITLSFDMASAIKDDIVGDFVAIVYLLDDEGNLHFYRTELVANTGFPEPPEPRSIEFYLPMYDAVIPSSGNRVVNINAIVIDQFGGIMQDVNPIYTIVTPYDGVTINSLTGFVTISSSTSVGTVRIRASYNDISRDTFLHLSLEMISVIPHVEIYVNGEVVNEGDLIELMDHEGGLLQVKVFPSYDIVTGLPTVVSSNPDVMIDEWYGVYWINAADRGATSLITVTVPTVHGSLTASFYVEFHNIVMRVEDYLDR